MTGLVVPRSLDPADLTALQAGVEPGSALALSLCRDMLLAGDPRSPTRFDEVGDCSTKCVTCCSLMARRTACSAASAVAKLQGIDEDLVGSALRRLSTPVRWDSSAGLPPDAASSRLGQLSIRAGQPPGVAPDGYGKTPCRRESRLASH